MGYSVAWMIAAVVFLQCFVHAVSCALWQEGWTGAACMDVSLSAGPVCVKISEMNITSREISAAMSLPDGAVFR